MYLSNLFYPRVTPPPIGPKYTTGYIASLFQLDAYCAIKFKTFKVGTPQGRYDRSELLNSPGRYIGDWGHMARGESSGFSHIRQSIELSRLCLA